MLIEYYNKIKSAIPHLLGQFSGCSLNKGGTGSSNVFMAEVSSISEQASLDLSDDDSYENPFLYALPRHPSKVSRRKKF